MWTGVTLLAGLVTLTLGAEILVRSASALAVAARLSPLVIGLTVVAYGTGAPELVVGLQSSFKGQSDLVVGNVLGSNIFNVLFILGLSAVIVPLRVSQQLVRWEVPLMIGLSLLLPVMAWDGWIGVADGLVLVIGMVAYTAWGILQSRKEQASIQAEYAAEFGSGAAKQGNAKHVVVQIALLAFGLLLLIVGAGWFTDAAVAVARLIGIPELVIGLTIVAVGTSLPEVATSVMAAVRGERDIAVGNAVGSNLFNLMAVLGVSAVLPGEGIMVSEAALQLDMPVMIAVSLACLPVFFTGQSIARWEGALFLAYFVAYTSYLILAHTHPPWSRTLASIMGVFVLPLTVITLLVTAIGAWRTRRRNPTETPTTR